MITIQQLPFFINRIQYVKLTQIGGIMMSMIQCANGHFYHEAQGPCPHCSSSDQGKTMGINQWNHSNPQPKPFPLPNKMGKVMSNHPDHVPAVAPLSDDGKTVGLFPKKEGIDPVVGWLVCIEGHDRGKDFSLHLDKNSIGRSHKNDVHIAGDPTISRENHATILYDQKKKQFRLLAGGGRGLVYLNDEAVDFGSVLKNRDLIEIGETKLLFIPFCGDEFNW